MDLAINNTTRISLPRQYPDFFSSPLLTFVPLWPPLCVSVPLWPICVIVLHFSRSPMRALTHDDALVWCEAHSVRADPSGHLYFSLDAAHSLLLNSPPAGHADDLLRALLPQPSETLFWIRPRTAWSESPGDKLFRGLRSAWGIEQPLAERPALLFQPSEQSQLLAALLPVLLFNWDAYLVPAPFQPQGWESRDSHRTGTAGTGPADAPAFAFTTQDVVCLVTRSQESQAALARQLRPFNPQPDSSWYFRRLQP